MVPGPSDLVADTKIRVEFDSDLTYRFSIQSSGLLRRRERKEAWRAERPLGEGASGSVWLHRCQAQSSDAELQAVKRMDKAKMASQDLDWHKELEAIAKFSQRKVRLPTGLQHFVELTWLVRRLVRQLYRVVRERYLCVHRHGIYRAWKSSRQSGRGAAGSRSARDYSPGRRGTLRLARQQLCPSGSQACGMSPISYPQSRS